MFIDENENPREGLFRYRSIHLSRICIAENHRGVIDTVYRKFRYSARAAQQKWGDQLPQRILDCIEKEPDKKFEFIHAVQPNEEYEIGRLGTAGMKYSSYYVCVEEKCVVSEGGYHTFPSAVSRYVTAPEEVYGRSPAMTVLPDIRMINAMNKTTIRAAQKMVEPPLATHGML